TPSGSNSRTPSVRRAETDDSEKAGRVWARTVDDPWWPCILTLDGGGIRGYSSLIIMKALMHEVWLWELRLDDEENTTAQHAKTEDQLMPCHYFDFMYGTSTGGLIATMLGRLRMTTEECLEVYREVGDTLFGRLRTSFPFATKYHHEPLEKAVQKIVASRCYEHDDCDGKDDSHPWQLETDSTVLASPFDVDKPRVSQSCCLTAVHNASISEAYLLRTYPHYYLDTAPNWITRYNEGADELKIWQVTRATSAAPFYFKMLEAEVDGEQKSFKDGGIRENNPSGAAMSEFHSLYNGKADRPAILLSVGTGRPDMTQDGFAHSWSGPISRIPWAQRGLEKIAVVRNLLIKYTEGERQHQDMRLYAHGENTWYKRLNVTYGLQNMPLDEWITGDWQQQKNVPGGASLTKMEKATEDYLNRDFIPEHNIDTYARPGVMLRQAAEKLVRQRRARENDGGIRWDTFVGKYL
ncbi:FabD/lysophospholipase-like protein, partial [Polychaeton citri CBS 116435]